MIRAKTKINVSALRDDVSSPLARFSHLFLFLLLCCAAARNATNLLPPHWITSCALFCFLFLFICSLAFSMLTTRILPSNALRLPVGLRPSMYLGPAGWCSASLFSCFVLALPWRCDSGEPGWLNGNAEMHYSGSPFPPPPVRPEMVRNAPLWGHPIDLLVFAHTRAMGPFRHGRLPTGGEPAGGTCRWPERGVIEMGDDGMGEVGCCRADNIRPVRRYPHG